MLLTFVCDKDFNANSWKQSRHHLYVKTTLVSTPLYCSCKKVKYRENIDIWFNSHFTKSITQPNYYVSTLLSRT